MESTGLREALPEYLREWQEKIEGYARRSGLDFFPQIFEVLSFDGRPFVTPCTRHCWRYRS